MVTPWCAGSAARQPPGRVQQTPSQGCGLNRSAVRRPPGRVHKHPHKGFGLKFRCVGSQADAPCSDESDGGAGVCLLRINAMSHIGRSQEADGRRALGAQGETPGLGMPSPMTGVAVQDATITPREEYSEAIFNEPLKPAAGLRWSLVSTGASGGAHLDSYTCKPVTALVIGHARTSEFYALLNAEHKISSW